MTRRGFTLVELLIGLLLLVVMGGMAYQVLVSQQRLARTQTERVALQSNIRTGATVLPNELRELSTGTGAADIIQMSADSITYRAMRSTGAACQVWPDSLRLRTSLFSGYRAISPGRDSLLLFVEHDVDTGTDDQWVALGIQSVAGGSTCPNGAAAQSVRFTSALNVGAIPLAWITLDAPVRTFEVMQVKHYAQGGKQWLGARSVSANEAIQPVLGPLAANGLTLTYRDSAGSVTTTPARVRRIELTIRGVSDELVRDGAGQGATGNLQDSLVTWVALRNAPLP